MSMRTDSGIEAGDSDTLFDDIDSEEGVAIDVDETADVRTEENEESPSGCVMTTSVPLQAVSSNNPDKPMVREKYFIVVERSYRRCLDG
jgi:hypothetical protein